MNDDIATIHSLLDKENGKDFAHGETKVRDSGMVGDHTFLSFYYKADGYGSYKNHEAFVKAALDAVADGYGLSRVFEASFSLRTSKLIIVAGETE